MSGPSTTAPATQHPHLFKEIRDPEIQPYTGRAEFGVTRFYRTPAQETVRVTIVHGFYLASARAVAEVLTPARTWSALVTDPPSRWHATVSPLPIATNTRHPVPGLETLTAMADNLYRDALDVLYGPGSGALDG